MQEQSSRREVSVLQEQLKSKEEILAEFQKSLLQKDRELERMKREDKSMQNQQVWLHNNYYVSQQNFLCANRAVLFGIFCA